MIPFTPATGPRILYSTLNDKKNTAEQIFTTESIRKRDIFMAHSFQKKMKKIFLNPLGSVLEEFQFMWKNNNYDFVTFEFSPHVIEKNLKEKKKNCKQDLEIKRLQGIKYL